MDPNDRRTQVFMDVQRGLPRQGPGDDASTLRALKLCTELPPNPQVLDVGCGPGMQTLALARALPETRIYAGDLCMEYLDQLVVSAEEAGLRERIGQMQLDMAELPFGRDSFDLIWSEGAAYIVGFGQALERWRDPLRPRGYLAVTELVWLTGHPPAEVAGFFASEYPAMTDVPANLATIETAGYEVLGHFTLPDAAWWQHYYTPLEAKLPELRRRYASDDEALAIVEATASEIDMRRRFGESYGYEFFVARSADPDTKPRSVEPEGGEGQRREPPSTKPAPSERQRPRQMDDWFDGSIRGVHERARRLIGSRSRPPGATTIERVMSRGRTLPVLTAERATDGCRELVGQHEVRPVAAQPVVGDAWHGAATHGDRGTGGTFDVVASQCPEAPMRRTASSPSRMVSSADVWRGWRTKGSPGCEDDRVGLGGPTRSELAPVVDTIVREPRPAPI